MNSTQSTPVSRALTIGVLVAATGLLYGAALEFYNVASGTGTWAGQLSFKWTLAFVFFVMFCVGCLAVFGLEVSGREGGWLSRSLLRLRNSVGRLRWLAVGIFLAIPVWFLQYSPWGVVFDKAYTRVLIWCLSSALVAIFIARERTSLWTWQAILVATLLCGAAFALAAPFMGVTSYPFSLGWSEGNRLWDYSLLFGKRLYTYPADSPPTAYLDVGRQLVGGMPFLLPRVTILGERLWLAVVAILPYLFLGWLAFWPIEKTVGKAWILAGVWAYMFLNQGPIHTPLVVCAIFVAVAWQSPNWLAVVLLFVASIAAEVSRFTWMFAPAMWAVMLELAGARSFGARVAPMAWKRALILGLVGVLGGVTAVAAGYLRGGTNIGAAASASTQQSLLWYRLFPNATYSEGVLPGLIMATAPLIVLLLVLAAESWRLGVLQKTAMILPLLAFLAVGLVVSAKIGGGGDLHNMDMFLIGLLFAAAAAWRAGGEQWLTKIQGQVPWRRALCLLLVALPAFQSLMVLRPLNVASDANWLVVLTDAPRPRDLGSLPSAEVVAASLDKLREAVSDAEPRGEVLFMDQRQLLTFGDVRDVPLVPEYEKKRMMDEALSGNSTYFEPFYRDLQTRRFSLIISSMLRTPIKDSEYGFGEENNAWVKWVAKPVLCYYEEQDTLTDVKVELLVPRVIPVDCSAELP